MRFEDLYPNFLSMSESEQLSFFTDYYSRRTIDLSQTVIAKVPVKKERGKGKTEKKISLTKEQFELMKKLGLC